MATNTNIKPDIIVYDKTDRNNCNCGEDTTIVNIFGDGLTQIVNNAIQQKMGELSKTLTKQLTEEISKTVFANLQGQTDIITDAVQGVTIQNNITHADEKIITKITEVPVIQEKIVTKNVVQEVPVLEKTIIEKPVEVIKLEKVEDAMSLEYPHLHRVLADVVNNAVNKPFFNNIPVYFNGGLNKDITGRVISKDIVTEIEVDGYDHRVQISVHLFGKLDEADFINANDCFLINAQAVASNVTTWEDIDNPGKFIVGGDITFEVIDYAKLDLPKCNVTVNQQVSFLDSEKHNPQVLTEGAKIIPDNILIKEVKNRGYAIADGTLDAFSNSDLIDELNARRLAVYLIGDYSHISTEDLEAELEARQK